LGSKREKGSGERVGGGGEVRKRRTMRKELDIDAPNGKSHRQNGSQPRCLQSLEKTPKAAADHRTMSGLSTKLISHSNARRKVAVSESGRRTYGSEAKIGPRSFEIGPHGRAGIQKWKRVVHVPAHRHSQSSTAELFSNCLGKQPVLNPRGCRQAGK